MDPISFVPASQSRMGGGDIVISLTPSQSKALGMEAGTLADWFHTALWAMAMLRSGRNSAGEPYTPKPDDWYTAINDLDHRLIPRLEGIRDAVVRAHDDSGGSIGNLALAMDVARSTAQHRRDVLQTSFPSVWEKWAKDGGPEDKGRPERDPHAPGTPVAGGFVIGQRVLITAVSGLLADRTDLIGKTGYVVAEARDGQITVRGLTRKKREVFADFLSFWPTELESAEDDQDGGQQ
ncbi:hypothetical protein PV377_30610 [Streptomyces ipomoeae]|uniref:hypothetical protein n=1 Tax=Streptomyces ipomoeae TaxID=103232 RepID=UPI0029B482F4|nr:hypothetical protein [Streptomyces ipomoeae]MDX2843249.1 hypothetical protein [Streptomyces ipomoeae]